MGDDRSRAEAEVQRLRERMRAVLNAWLEERGIAAEVGISGFVSPSGEPKVLINVHARVAAALIEGITADKAQPSAPPPQTPPPPPWAPEHPGWSAPPQAPPPHRPAPPPQGYGPDGWHGHRD